MQRDQTAPPEGIGERNMLIVQKLNLRLRMLPMKIDDIAFDGYDLGNGYDLGMTRCLPFSDK